MILFPPIWAVKTYNCSKRNIWRFGQKKKASLGKTAAPEVFTIIVWIWMFSCHVRKLFIRKNNQCFFSSLTIKEKCFFLPPTYMYTYIEPSKWIFKKLNKVLSPKLWSTPLLSQVNHREINVVFQTYIHFG